MGASRPPLPARLVEQARAYADGSATPAEPRDAATVVLLRPGGATSSAHARHAMEVYLLRRQTSMAFAGGMCVFPGGGVDPRDREHPIDADAWAGPTPAQWAARLGTDQPLARALVCAAVRETFEESGVLLAGTRDEVVADTSGDDWEADRAALEAHELAFTDLLERRGLVLRTDLLGAWVAWCTPVFEPRRYRTWFFVAALPPGQVTRDVSTESSAVMWVPPGKAVAMADRDEVAMMPPTWLTCRDVERYGDPAGVLAEAGRRTLTMFTPEVVETEDGFGLTSPPQYDGILT